MKQRSYDGLEWEPWFRTLDIFEQEWFTDCLDKREDLNEQLRGVNSELQRLRQRGMQRQRRRELAGTA